MKFEPPSPAKAASGGNLVAGGMHACAMTGSEWEAAKEAVGYWRTSRMLLS